MRSLWLLCFLSLGSLVLCDDYDADERTAQYVNKFKRAFAEANISDTEVLRDPYSPTSVNYDCELDASEPTSVNNLSPQYVDVVAAMGDSVTAAMGAGASTIITDLIQYRGMSWSIGGDNTVESDITLPNILKTYNPNIDGFSIKTGGPNSANARLNVAVVGDVARNMEEQAVKLIEKMKARGVTDDQWKVITIWIGANDLCADRTCDNTASFNAEKYIGEIKVALDILKRDVPRAFVNLVGIIDVSEIGQVKGPLCGIVHRFACNCGRKEEYRQHVKDTATLFNVRIVDLLETGIYDTDDDFTVVYQPFFSETAVPMRDGSPDTSYFAPDCFHFSKKGHQVGATYLWNNMFEPVGAKTDRIDWNNLNEIACPKDNPYFATKQNSLANSVSSNEKGTSHSNLAAILLGTGVGVVFIAIVAVVVSVGVIVQRRKRAARDQSERIHLIFSKN